MAVVVAEVAAEGMRNGLWWLNFETGTETVVLIATLPKRPSVLEALQVMRIIAQSSTSDDQLLRTDALLLLQMLRHLPKSFIFELDPLFGSMKSL